MKVEVFYQNFAGETGYDVRIIDPQATVQDYLDVLNNFILNDNLTRTRSAVTVCEGCIHCCSERIPLTNADIIRLWQSNPGSGSTVSGILQHFGEVVNLGPGYDATLKRFPTGTCHFLNQESGRCTIYHFRPLVCQSFICCPSSLRAEELRSTIVNQGEDELIRLWRMDQVLTGREDCLPLTGQSDTYAIGSDNAFTGKTQYNEILLRELCHPRLWAELTKS